MRYLITLLLLSTLLFGSVNSNSSAIDILPKSKIIFGAESLDINSSTTLSNFKPYKKNSIHLTPKSKILWVELSLESKSINSPVLYATSPLLTTFKVFDQNATLLKDLSYGKRQEQTLLPYYGIKSNSPKKLYLQIETKYMPVNLALKLESKRDFLKKDTKSKFYNSILLGILIALIILLLLYLSLTKKRELFYLIVLIVSVIYFQLSDIGFMQIFASYYYVFLDITISTIKINIITIALFFYSVSFLSIDKNSRFYAALKLLTIMAGLEVFIAGFVNIDILYALLPLLLTLLLFIQQIAIAVLHKRREHIFTLLGYIILLATFMTVALKPYLPLTGQKAYGLSFIVSVIALILIASSYIYSFIQKEMCSTDELVNSLDRKYLLENMLQTKKDELEALDKTKEVLTTDVHTIISNNFNKILGLLQADVRNIDYSKLNRQLGNLEQRMQAISLCYSHMLESKNLASIEMDSVVEEIVEQIKVLYKKEDCNIIVKRDIDAKLAINDATRAATTISEMLMDIYKNGCSQAKGLSILISLKMSDSSYTLNIKDTQNNKEKRVATTALQSLKEKLQSLKIRRAT